MYEILPDRTEYPHECKQNLLVLSKNRPKHPIIKKANPQVRLFLILSIFTKRFEQFLLKTPINNQSFSFFTSPLGVFFGTPGCCCCGTLSRAGGTVGGAVCRLSRRPSVGLAHGWACVLSGRC
jgi:hypothetical protein